VSLPLQAISEALFDRLASHAAGAAVREKLGAGAASIIAADALGRTPRPATAFLVWRGGAVGGSSLELRRVTGVWWAYDDPARGYARSNEILAAIEAAYPFDAVAFGRTRVAFIGQEADDRSMGLLTRPIQIIYTRRA
jgi:hypothetical protein